MVGRRGFIAGAGCVAVCAAAAEKGAKAHGAKKRKPRIPIMPPGAQDRQHFLSHCIACGLCISRCPHQALSASGLEYGLRGMQFPRLDFAKGFCDWDCHSCTKICPTGALEALSHGIKRRVKVGDAKWKRHHCVVITDGVSCGLCAKNCPTQAIAMKKDESGREVPAIDAEKCIGCGTCEYFCAAKPKAIFVQGIAKHEFLFGAETFVAELRNRRMWSSAERGIRPLLAAIGNGVDLSGAVCHDRIVGRAAAVLCVKAKVCEVRSPVMSRGAFELLKKFGVVVRADSVVDGIRNRAGTGSCPMEQAVAAIPDDDIERAYRTLVDAAAPRQ